MVLHKLHRCNYNLYVIDGVFGKNRVMSLFRPLIALCVSSTFLLSACGSSVDPAFSTEHRYQHELFSPDVCARLRQTTNEVNCIETVEFSPSGKASLFLGGGDIGVVGDYQRKGNKITVNTTSTYAPQQTLVFTVVSDNELSRAGSNDRWFKY